MGKILRAFMREELQLEPLTAYSSEETQAAKRCADKLEEQFRKNLNLEQQETYSKLLDAQNEESYLNEIDRIVFGYRLGTLMTMEVFTDMNELFSNREGR